MLIWHFSQLVCLLAPDSPAEKNRESFLCQYIVLRCLASVSFPTLLSVSRIASLRIHKTQNMFLHSHLFSELRCVWVWVCERAFACRAFVSSDKYMVRLINMLPVTRNSASKVSKNGLGTSFWLNQSPHTWADSHNINCSVLLCPKPAMAHLARQVDQRTVLVFYPSHPARSLLVLFWVCVCRYPESRGLLFTSLGTQTRFVKPV